MLVKISLDQRSYIEKDRAKADAGQISRRIASNDSIMTMDHSELADAVGNRGFSFSPSIFTGSRKQNCFREMQLFALDFDNGTEYQTVAERLNKYELPVLFSYHSLSSTQDHPKYRIILCHGAVIRDRQIAEFILAMLKFLFPEADRSCFEVSRIFFGGKKLISCHEGEEYPCFYIERLSYHYQYCLKQKDPKNFASRQRTLAITCGVGVGEKNFFEIENVPAEFQEFAGSNEYIYMSFPANSLKMRIKRPLTLPKHHKGSREIKVIEKVEKEKLMKACRLWEDFMEGNELPHGDKFRLAANIIYMKGMRTVFLKQISERGEDLGKWKYDIDYMDAHSYKPMSCAGCPYEEKCIHDGSLYQSMSGSRNIRRTVEEVSYVDIDTAYNKMMEALLTGLDDPGDTIHLIKAQTGLGKTNAYMELIRDHGYTGERHLMIAVPQVTLKREISSRLSGLILASTSFDDLCIPEEVRQEAKDLYERDLYREAKNCLAEYLEENENTLLREEFRKYMDLPGYLEEHPDSHVIVTHAQFLNLPDHVRERYQLVVDEDILYTIMRSTGSMDLQEIQNAYMDQVFPNAIHGKILKILDLKEGEYYSERRSGWEKDYYISEHVQNENGIHGSLNSFINAKTYCRKGDDILFFAGRELPKQKMIILSATLHPEVYQLYASDRRIIFHDIPQVRYKGKLIQYTRHSMSRGDLTQKLDKMKAYLQKTHDHKDYTITFLKMEKELGKDHLHFGNVTGIDAYKGKKGIIIGTPHFTDECYKLIGKHIGIQVEQEKLCSRRVCMNGFEFLLMSYSSEKLRSLQLYMISTELEQAVGRSRLLRTDGEIILYSSFPCCQAEIRQEDYLIEKDAADEQMQYL